MNILLGATSLLTPFVVVTSSWYEPAFKSIRAVKSEVLEIKMTYRYMLSLFLPIQD